MFEALGPFSRSYDSGIRTAIGVLHDSWKPGCHEAAKNYSSCRKVCSLSTNIHNAAFCMRSHAKLGLALG
jgi:hypothetical protein